MFTMETSYVQSKTFHFIFIKDTKQNYIVYKIQYKVWIYPPIEDKNYIPKKLHQSIQEQRLRPSCESSLIR